MPWIYEQKTGRLRLNDQHYAVGYSGFGRYKNDPDEQKMIGLGPLPQGAYLIGPLHDHASLGPAVMDLNALPATQTFGRGDFRIHGDSSEHPGAASHGCIILSRAERNFIAASNDRLLVVLSGNPVNGAQPCGLP